MSKSRIKTSVQYKEEKYAAYSMEYKMSRMKLKTLPTNSIRPQKYLPSIQRDKNQKDQYTFQPLQSSPENINEESMFKPTSQQRVRKFQLR